jgi:hypothetical protein
MGGVLLVRLRWPGELAIHEAPRRPHSLSEIIVLSVWILKAETALGIPFWKQQLLVTLDDPLRHWRKGKSETAL